MSNMSTFVGITPNFPVFFSLISRVFTNFNENFYLIICILDNLVNMQCLSINLNPSLILKGT